MTVAVLVAAVAASGQAGAPGSSCNRPLRWLVPPRVFDEPSGSHVRRLPDGSKLTLSFNSYERTVDAETSSRQWRVCGLNTRGNPTRIYAPVSNVGGTSGVNRRIFGDSYPSLSIWYARRDRALDGNSCANPYVIASPLGYAFPLDFSGSPMPVGPVTGDLHAGRVNETWLGHQKDLTGTWTAHWQAAPGYRICLAAGSVTREDPDSTHLFVDRRHGTDLSHLIYSVHGGGPSPETGGLGIEYFFVAYRRT